MNPIRVVIAEDDKQIAEIQTRFLERIEGFELVGLAHGLQEAEDLVEVLKPDLLLLDNHFPTGTGLDLLRKIRAENSATDVILITAAKEVTTLRDAMRGGVFDYILKPLVFERLQETLGNFRNHLVQLQTMNSIDQREVDRLIPRAPVDANSTAPTANRNTTRLPKGIDPLTLESVRTVINDASDSLSAEQVGELIGASRTTARRYLEFLVSNNELDAEVNYGTVGRPERRYHRGTSH